MIVTNNVTGSYAFHCKRHFYSHFKVLVSALVLQQQNENKLNINIYFNMFFIIILFCC